MIEGQRVRLLGVHNHVVQPETRNDLIDAIKVLRGGVALVTVLSTGSWESKERGSLCFLGTDTNVFCLDCAEAHLKSLEGLLGELE